MYQISSKSSTECFSAETSSCSSLAWSLSFWHAALLTFERLVQTRTVSLVFVCLSPLCLCHQFAARGFAHLCLTDLSLTDAYKQKRLRLQQQTKHIAIHCIQHKAEIDYKTTSLVCKAFQAKNILSQQIWPC